jgi:hypothetical protein
LARVAISFAIECDVNIDVDSDPNIFDSTLQSHLGRLEEVVALVHSLLHALDAIQN